MTQAATIVSNLHVADGIQTDFPIGFEVNDDLIVEVDGIARLGQISADQSTVSLIPAPAAGAKVALLRETPRTQPANLSDKTQDVRGSIEEQLDRTVRMVQELKGGLDSTLRLNAGETPLPLPISKDTILIGSADGSGFEAKSIGTPSARAARVLAFDETGSPVAIPLGTSDVAELMNMQPGQTVPADTTLRALGNGWYTAFENVAPDPITEFGLAQAGFVKGTTDTTKINPKIFGAKGNVIALLGASFIAGTNLVTLSGDDIWPDDAVSKTVAANDVGPLGGLFVGVVTERISNTVIRVDTFASVSATVSARIGTDDTDAIEAAWAYLQAQPSQNYINTTARNILTLGLAYHLYFEGGFYFYNGAGLLPNTDAGRNVHIYGSGKAQVFIETLSDTHFIKHDIQEKAINSLGLKGFKHFGGQGLYLDTHVVGVPQSGQWISDVDVLDYWGAGIVSYADGAPRWYFENVTLETQRHNTKAIVFNVEFANPAFINVSILGNTYGLVMPEKGTSGGIINGINAFRLAGDDQKAAIWFTPSDSTGQGQGIIITGNRFSNEHRQNAPWVLFARPDTASGAMLHEQVHSTDPVTDKPYLRDITISGNSAAGQGNADTATGSLVKSYVADIGALSIVDNVIGTSFKYLLDMEYPPTTGYASDLVIGPNKYTGKGEPPVPCNLDIGHWRRSDGVEMGSPGTPFTYKGSDDPNANILNAAGNVIGTAAQIVTTGAATNTPVADRFSSAGAARLKFTALTELARIPISTLGDNIPGQSIFVEFEAKKSGTSQIREIDLTVTPVLSTGGEAHKEPIVLTDNWRTYVIPVNANQAMTGLTVEFSPSADDFQVNAQDSFDISRPFVYASNRPLSTGNTRKYGRGFNAGRTIEIEDGGPGVLQEWVDWDTSSLMASFGNPAAADDGLLRVLMESAGRGQNWTPQIIGNSAAGSATYGTQGQQGRYFQLGKLILGWGRVVWTAHTGTGNGRIIGLPESLRAQSVSRGLFIPITAVGMPTAPGSILSGYINHVDSNIILTQTNDAGFTSLALPSSGTLNFAFAYEAA